MNNRSVSKRPRTSLGKKYADGMSRFFGEDVSYSEPVQNYDEAVMKWIDWKHQKVWPPRFIISLVDDR